jgi:hypothetical protein
MIGATRKDANVVLEGGAPSPQQATLCLANRGGFSGEVTLKIACCGDGAPPSSTTFAQITDQPLSSPLRLLQMGIKISMVQSSLDP